MGHLPLEGRYQDGPHIRVGAPIAGAAMPMTGVMSGRATASPALIGIGGGGQDGTVPGVRMSNPRSHTGCQRRHEHHQRQRTRKGAAEAGYGLAERQ